jgi:hypothetical protein
LAEQFNDVDKRRTMGRRLVRSQKTLHFSEQFTGGTISFQWQVLKGQSLREVAGSLMQQGAIGNQDQQSALGNQHSAFSQSALCSAILGRSLVSRVAKTVGRKVAER